jgi:hypothetical protein
MYGKVTFTCAMLLALAVPAHSTKSQSNCFYTKGRVSDTIEGHCQIKQTKSGDEGDSFEYSVTLPGGKRYIVSGETDSHDALVNGKHVHADVDMSLGYCVSPAAPYKMICFSQESVN